LISGHSSFQKGQPVFQKHLVVKLLGHVHAQKVFALVLPWQDKVGEIRRISNIEPQNRRTAEPQKLYVERRFFIEKGVIIV
jgi:hypothetical protein